jgi:thioredoxin reductase
MEDVVVIGGGPAGLAAALWLGRYRRRTVVIDGEEGRNRFAHAAHGYLGQDGWNPEKVREVGRADVDRYDSIRRVHTNAAEIAREGERFQVVTDDEEYVARRILLATGVKDVTPDIPGFMELYGEHIFHCSCCDGYESSDQDVLAIGWGEHAAGFALDLLEWGARVTLVTNGEEFEGNRSCETALARNGIEVIEERVTSFSIKGGHMTGATVGSGRVIPATRAFFSIKHEPRNQLALELGCKTDEMGYVEVGPHGETSVDNVYAAGDLTPGEQLVQTAAAEGAVAGIACAMSLRGASAAAPDVPDPGPDPRTELTGP